MTEGDSPQETPNLKRKSSKNDLRDLSKRRMFGSALSMEETCLGSDEHLRACGRVFVTTETAYKEIFDVISDMISANTENCRQSSQAEPLRRVFMLHESNLKSLQLRVAQFRFDVARDHRQRLAANAQQWKQYYETRSPNFFPNQSIHEDDESNKENKKSSGPIHSGK